MIPPPLCPAIGGVAATQEALMNDILSSSEVRVAMVPPEAGLTEVGG
jgi:hypothetical protein